MPVQLARTQVQLTVEDAKCRGGLAIFLGQSRPTAGALTSRYLVQVRATTADGQFEVGSFVTCPPHDGSSKTRQVASASCPGALSWTLIAKPLAGPGGTLGECSGSLFASAGEPGGQLPGVVRVAERSKYYAGNAAASVTLPVGERVLSWSAFSTGAGASLTYGRFGTAPQTIPLPTAGGVSGGLVQGGDLPLVFSFSNPNFGGYYIEAAESA